MTDQKEVVVTTTCQECGMPCDAREYHPYAACLMFKACHDSTKVRANLQAVMDHGAALDAKRLDALEFAANKKGGILLHDGQEEGRCGLGLRPGDLVRTLRQAIDSYMDGEMKL